MTDQHDSFWANADRKPRLNKRCDPFVGRLVAVALVVGLLVPVALALGDGGGAPQPIGLGAAALFEPANDVATVMPETVTPETVTPETVISETVIPAVVVAAPVASTVPITVPKPRCGATFNVKLGDSWSLLGDYGGVSTRDLLQVNNATVKTVIVPGDELCLPRGSQFKRPAPVATNTVAPLTIPSNTSKKTVTTHKPVVVVAAKRFTVAQSTQLIRDAFGEALTPRALKIAQRESNINAAAYNSCCYGLFQIHFEAHKSWLVSIGIKTPSQLLDAGANVRAAITLYQRSGSWAAWE